MWLCLAFLPLAVVLFPAGVGERSSGQSHVTPVLNTQTHTLTSILLLVAGKFRINEASVNLLQLCDAVFS